MLDSFAMRFPIRLLLIAAVAGAALAPGVRSHADEAPSSERATFRIMLHGRTIGTETVTSEDLGDSLLVTSNGVQLLGAGSGDSLIKNIVIVVDSWDLNLRDYHSQQSLRGQITKRGLLMHDSTIVSFRQVDSRGTGDTSRAPIHP